MPSQIDPSKPVDDAPAIKADLCANLLSAYAASTAGVRLTAAMPSNTAG